MTEAHLDYRFARSWNGGAKTEVGHWDAGWGVVTPTRYSSPFDPFDADVQRLLSPYVTPGSNFLEIGFAPGRVLAWAAAERSATVSGIDYSPSGVAAARGLFRHNNIEGDLRAEDVFETSFAPESFDCVFSAGLIEHFDEPAPIVAKHVELVRPGGAVIILVPNYGGLIGRIERWLDPEIMALHNQAIMRPRALAALFDRAQFDSVHGFKFGRLCLAGLSLDRIMPAALAWLLQRASGVAASAIPFRIPPSAACIAAIAIKKG